MTLACAKGRNSFLSSPAPMPMPLSANVKIEPHLTARQTFCRGSKGDGPFVRKLHRIVGEIFQCRAQPHPVSRHESRQIGRDSDLCPDCLAARACGERGADGFSQRTWRERLVLKQQSACVRFGGINNQCSQRRQMIGTAFDGRSPFALARA